MAVYSMADSRVLHDFDTPRVEWPYIQWQTIKESYNTDKLTDRQTGDRKKSYTNAT